MEMKELLEFIDFEDGRLNRHYNIDCEKKILARTVKLSEELGELANDVLAHGSLQSNAKLESHDKENINHEFADVIITAMLLAKSMNINIEKALEKKIRHIREKREV